MKTLLFLFSTVLFFQGCTSQSSKINGVSFVASGEAATQNNVDALLAIHSNYAAVMPFGFIRNKETPEILFNTPRQWYGERVEGTTQYIQMLQNNNIQVMLKPQLWLWHGEYTGYLKMNTEEQWLLLEKTYRNFIITFAKVAAKENVALFCIGTELEQFILARPQFWIDLIAEVKTIYKGSLTYAANWDEYKRVPFWEALDYIGIDGYFPVSESKTPTVEEALAGWQPWKVEMKEVSKKWNLPLLFTEYGYRSVDYAGKEPWNSNRNYGNVNLEAQTNLMNAFFTTIYPEDWFAGGFIWKWYIDDDSVGGLENDRFTPQNKPVEKIIKHHFLENK